ncbi:MAG: Fic family protein [Thermodesulfobacteriota bacterium]|nr:Fic family protein [Thermodesulfobacteriota bacterium]
MFNPNFKYTNKIVNSLLKIMSARDTILNSYIIPKWEISLRRDALIRAAHASTAIEGNKLTLEEVSKLADGRKITAERKDKQEVLNYLKVLEDIDKYHEKGRITEKHILKLHKDISREVLENPENEGFYRKMPVYVGNKITGDIVFMPPPAENVPALMKELTGWLNSEESVEFNPVLVAGIAHYEFVRIHPFVDGNGRTARALATLILFTRGFDIKRFFALDDYYDSDRRLYYEALKSVDPKSIETTQWLEYFIYGVFISMTRVKERVLKLSLEKHKKDTRGQIALTERQMQILESIIKNGRITSGEIQKMFNISRQAAHKELKKMLSLELIEPKGEGKAVYYIVCSG